MIAYFDRPSPVHALDPRVKIAWSVAVSLLAVLLQQPLMLGGLFALTIAPWCLVRPPLARLRLLFVLVGTTVLGTMISQGFFYGFEPRTELLTLLPGLSLCREGVLYGAVVSLRLLSVLSAGALVVFTTYPSDLILALTKLRVPHSFAFMLTLALRFPARDHRARKTHPGGSAVAWGRRERLGVRCSSVSVLRCPTAGRFATQSPVRSPSLPKYEPIPPIESPQKTCVSPSSIGWSWRDSSC